MSSFTVQPSIESRYFDPHMFALVEYRVTQLVFQRTGLWVNVDGQSLHNVLYRILNQRRETYDKMIDRCVMELSAEIVDYVLERNRNLKWAETYEDTQRIYNQSALMGPDTQLIKQSKQRVPLGHYFNYSWQGGG